MAGNSMDMQINFDFQAKNLDQIVSQINQIQQAFQQKGQSVGFNDKDIKAYSNSLEILKQNTVKTFDVMNSKASSNKVGQALKQAGVDANNLQNAMRKLGVNGVSSLDNVSKSAAQAKRELGKIGEGLKEISHTFTSALKWNMAYGAINAMSSSLKDAVYFAKELDSTLTDIRIVAGLTKDEAVAFGQEATQLSQRLGATTLDYAKASLIYFQQGLDTSQVKEMADATVMAANITGESAANMSDYLTAVVNGYGMVTDQAMDVVDKLAAVGAATAANFGELSIGMSKVASMAKTAGVPIEKLAAQLSTIISTTREAPESVGTSLKTIYSRMLQFKTGTGTDSEGESFSVPAVEKALEKFNQSAGTSISIFGKNGQLREDMGTVLEELGEKWDQVTDQQAKFGVATAIAGTRQMNNLMALLNGWDEYKSAVEVAQNSEGEGWKENEIFMDSYEGKVKQLKSAQQGLYQNLFSADDMKPFIEGLTVVIKGTSQLAKLFGGLPGILIALGPLLLSKLSVPLSQAVQNVKILRSTQASPVDKNEAKIDSLQNKGMITDEQAKKLKTTNDEIRKNEELIASIQKVKQARQDETEALDKATQKQREKINSKEYYKADENGKNTQKGSIMNRFFETSMQGDEGAYTKQAKNIVNEESAKAQREINSLKLTGQQREEKIKEIEEQTNETIKKRLIDLAKESKFNDEHVRQAREEREAVEGATGISSETSNKDLDNMSDNAGTKNAALQSDIDGTTKSLEDQYAAQMNVNMAISAGMSILLTMNQSYSSFGEALMSGLVPALSMVAYTVLPAIITGAKTLRGILNSTGGKVGLILTAISALTGVIKWFADSSKRAAEANKEFQDSFKQQNSTIAQNASTLKDLSDKYEVLSKGVDDSGVNWSLTNEQYEEYKSIISQISEIMPSLAVKYNAQGEAIGFVTGKLQDLNEEYKKTKQKNFQELLFGEDNTKHNFDDVWKAKKGDDRHREYYGDAVSEISNDQEFIAYLRDIASQNDIPEIVSQNLMFKLAQEAGIDNYKGTDEQKNQIKQAAIKIADEVETDINKDVQDLRNIAIAQFGYSFVTKLSDEQFEQGNQIINQIDFSGMSKKEAQNWIKDLGNNIQTEEFQEAFKKIFENANKKTLKELNDIAGEQKFQEALGLNEDQIAAILHVNEYNKNKEVYNNFIDELDKVSNKDNLKSLADQIPASEIGELRDAVESLKNSNIDLNNITLDQLREEIEKTKKYNEVLAQSFEDVSKKMDEMQSAYSTVKDAITTYNETGLMSIDNLQDIMSLKTEYLMLFTNEQGELDLSTEKIKDYVEALRKEMILTKLNEMIDEFIKLSPQERQERINNTDAINNEADAIERLIKAKALEAAQKDWNSMQATNVDLNNGRIKPNFPSTIPGQATITSKEDLEQQYKDYFNNMYSGLNKLFSATSWDLRSDSNDSDNKKNREDLEKKEKDLAKKRKERDKQYKELAKKEKAVTEAQEGVADAEKDLQDAIEGVAEAQQDLIDKQEEYNDLLKDHEVERYKESIEELTSAMEKLDDVASAIDSVMGLLGKDDYQKKYNLTLQKMSANDNIIAEANREYQDLVNSPVPEGAEAQQARADAIKKAQDKKFDAEINKEKLQQDLKNINKEAQDRIDASNKELFDNTNSYFDNYVNNIKNAIDSIKGILDDFKRWQQGEISQEDFWTLTALNLENAALSLTSPIEKKDMTELDVTSVDSDELLSRRKADLDEYYAYAAEARAKAREEAEKEREKEKEESLKAISDAEERIADAQEKVKDAEKAIEDAKEKVAEAIEAVADQNESIAETTNEIADLQTEIGTLKQNLSGTMGTTKKIAETANTATEALNVTKQAAEEASKAVENAANEISSEASVGTLTNAIVNTVQQAAVNAKANENYRLLIPDVLWGSGAITSFNTPTNVDSKKDGLIGAMYGVVMYCIQQAKTLTKGKGDLYGLYVPNVNWGRNTSKTDNNQSNNYNNLIGVMCSTVLYCFSMVNNYLQTLKNNKNSNGYNLIAPGLNADWDKLQSRMETKVMAAIDGLNEKIQGMTIKAPTADQSGWEQFGSTISSYINSGIKQVLLKGGSGNTATHPFVNSDITTSEMTGNETNIEPGMSVFFTEADKKNHAGMGHVGIMSKDKKHIYHLEGKNGLKSSTLDEMKRAGHDFVGAGWETGKLSDKEVEKLDDLFASNYTFGLKNGACQAWVSKALKEVQGTKDRIYHGTATDAWKSKLTTDKMYPADLIVGGSSSTSSNKFAYDDTYSALYNLFAKTYIDGIPELKEIYDEVGDMSGMSENERLIALCKVIFNKFSKAGWGKGDEEALSLLEMAAIIGNIKQESNYNPKSENSIGAYGLLQWLKGRRTGLDNWAEQNGREVSSLSTQVDYLAYEASNTSEASSFNKFKRSGTSLEDLTIGFRTYYERPGKHEAMDDNRIAGAKQAYEILKNIDKYSVGTKDGTHPGGLAMVGDEAKGKYEYVQTPDGKITKMGEHGAEIVNLPRGTTVFSHSDSVALEKVYGRGLKGLPKYAKGTFVANYKDYTITMYGENGGNDIKWLHSHGQVDEFATQLVNEGWINKTNNSKSGSSTSAQMSAISLEDAGVSQEEYNNMSYYDRINYGKNNSSATDENTKALNANTEAQNNNTEAVASTGKTEKTVNDNNKFNEELSKMWDENFTKIAEPLAERLNETSKEMFNINNNQSLPEDEKQRILKSTAGEMYYDMYKDFYAEGGIFQTAQKAAEDQRKIINQYYEEGKITLAEANRQKEKINKSLSDLVENNSGYQKQWFDIMFSSIDEINQKDISYRKKMNADTKEIRKLEEDNISEMEEAYAEYAERMTKEQRQQAKEAIQDAKKNLYDDERSDIKDELSLFEDDWKDNGEFGKIAEYYRKELDLLTKAYQDGVISIEEYTQGVKEQTDNLEALNDAQRSRIQTQFDAAISAVNDAFDDVKEALNDQKTAITNYYDLENKLSELQASKSKEYDATLRNNYDKQIEYIKQQKELYKNQTDPRVQAEMMRNINESLKSFDLMIAQDILEKKRNQKVNRIFNQDTQTFDWVEDFDAISEAEQLVSNTEKELKLLEISNEQERYDLRKKDLTEALEANQKAEYYKQGERFFGDFVTAIGDNGLFDSLLKTTTTIANDLYQVKDELNLNNKEKNLTGTDITEKGLKDYTHESVTGGKEKVRYSANTDYTAEMLKEKDIYKFMTLAARRLQKSIDQGDNAGISLKDIAKKAGMAQLFDEPEFQRLIALEERYFPIKDYSAFMMQTTSKKDFKNAAKLRNNKVNFLGTNYGVSLRNIVDQNPNFEDLFKDSEIQEMLKNEGSQASISSEIHPEWFASNVPKLKITGRDWLKDVMSHAVAKGMVRQDFANSIDYNTLNTFNGILGKVRSGDNIDSSISKEEIKNITVNVGNLELTDNEKEVFADTLMKAIERQSITDNK